MNKWDVFERLKGSTLTHLSEYKEGNQNYKRTKQTCLRKKIIAMCFTKINIETE